MSNEQQGAPVPPQVPASENQQQGWQAPAQPTPPQPQQGGWQAPPQPQQGWGQPAQPTPPQPQQPGWQAPPQPQQNWGQPNQQQQAQQAWGQQGAAQQQARGQQGAQQQWQQQGPTAAKAPTWEQLKAQGGYSIPPEYPAATFNPESFSLPACLFNWIWYMVKGMWQKGLLLLAAGWIISMFTAGIGGIAVMVYGGMYGHRDYVRYHNSKQQFWW